MGNKYMKHAFAFIMKAIVYIILGPAILIYYGFLRCILALQIRRLEMKGCNDTQGSLGRFRQSTIIELTDVSNAEKLDFKKNRSMTYIDQVTSGTLWEISRFACGRQTIPLVSNHVLHHALFNSPFSYGLVKEENPLSEVAWHFSLEEMGKYKLFQEFYWDVEEIMVLKSGKLNIRDRSGKIHTPRCKTWTLAKAHAQVQLTFFVPGLSHNHVHFVLPSVIAYETRKKLPETSVLRQLIEPHTRFTQYINHQALNKSISSCNTRSFSDRLFRPWLCMPVDNDEFIKGIAKKCEQFYSKNNCMVPKLEDDIPYQSFLKMYYAIFHKYVSDLAPFLKSDYEILRKAMAEHIPGILNQNMIDVLVGFLWNSAVVHFADHETYLQQWARKYGCMGIRIPLVTPHAKDKEVEVNTISSGKINGSFNSDCISAYKKNHQNSNDVIIETYHYSKEDGSRFFRSIDICRTRCFLRTFVQYNENPKVNMKLFDTEYAFTDSAVKRTAANFLMELRDLSSIQRQRGEAIVKGENFIRSVCF
ncbi:uncharacterized protein LOC120340534 [Styela clava]